MTRTATPDAPERDALGHNLHVSELLTWRVIRDTPLPGAVNMARDHALAAHIGEGEAVLRLYAWECPTVSFGRNEPARGLYSRREAARLGIDYVRRPTGGRAVLHHHELTYAVIAPARTWGGLRDAYRLINDALAGALRTLGAPVALASETTTPSVDAGPCFQAPAGGEVTAGGRKLVGSAQCRIEGALLQHGSIILDGDQSLLARLNGKSVEEHAAPATLSGLVGARSSQEVEDAVVRGMGATLGGHWADGAYTREESETAGHLVAERYGMEQWTWRR